MLSWRVGAIKITRIVEMELPPGCAAQIEMARFSAGENADRARRA